MAVMTGQLFSLDEDYEAGLQQAVNNNQPSLAFQYLLRKLEAQDARIAELEERIASEPKQEAPRKTTTAKKTAKKTSAKSEE